MKRDALGYIEARTSAIPELSSIRLYDATRDKIIARHPEFTPWLPSIEHAVMDTLINPTSVFESRSSPNSFVFTSSNHTRYGHALSVPVKIVDNRSGRVATAIFGSSPRGTVLFNAGGGHD